MTDLRILDRAEIAAQRVRLLAMLGELDAQMMSNQPEAIIANAERGQWQLWASGGINALAATRVSTNGDDTLRLQWEGCVGTGQDWPTLARRIERWALKRGCSKARIYGRAGWCRVLGYEPVAVIAERVLT